MTPGTLFVYEFCSAAGPADSLYAEGRAMRDALAADFGRVPGLTVRTLDGPDEDAFLGMAAAATATIIIAPELGGELERRCASARAARGHLLNADAPALSAAADKLATACRWRAAGVPTPPAIPLSEALRDPPPFPCVGKPVRGAGSTATYRLDTAADLARLPEWAAADGLTPADMLVEPFVPGVPASIAFLVGPAGVMPLPPALQRLSADGRFHYQGGEVPIGPPLADRATRLGAAAIAAFDGLRGWVGVDLILGAADDGSVDVAVEINPRLTTSYVGLRALCAGNLAAAWWALEAGELPGLTWKPGPVVFGERGT